MKLKTKLSLAAATAIAGSILLTGCGGGGSGGTTGSATTLSKVTGSVTSSTFENALVFLDLNLDGNYTQGEPQAITNKNGEYTLNHYFEENKEYLLIAKGSSENNTTRWIDQDNNVSENAYDLMMFSSIIGNSEKEINPLEFKSFLGEIKNTLGTADGNVTVLLDSNETNISALYKDFFKDKNSTAIYNQALQSAIDHIKLKNAKSQFSDARTSLGVDDNTTLFFDTLDKNVTDLADDPAFKNKTFPSKIGDLVVSNKLNTVEIEVTTDVDSDNIEGVTAVDNNQSGDSNTSSVILKKPIYSVIGSPKTKVVIGDKSNIAEYGDITLSVTPYKDILSIPFYDQLKTKGVAPVLGADITVENSNGDKIAISEIAPKEISGVILDKNKNNIGEAVNDLSYYYLDENLTWVDGGSITDGGTLTLSDSFKLVPYVIVKDVNDTMQDPQEITVDGLSSIKDPVVVVKGKKVSQVVGSKTLFDTTTNETDTVVLDATGTLDSTNSKATFIIPTGYEITELVVLGEELGKVNDGQNSIKAEVTGGSASIADGLSLITNSQIINDLKSSIASHIAYNINLAAMETPKLLSAPSTAPVTDDPDTDKYTYILYTNNNRFLGDEGTQNNTFYTGSDFGASDSYEVVTDTGNANDQEKTVVQINSSNKTITKTWTKTYTYSDTYNDESYSGSTTITHKTVYDYTTENSVGITNTISYTYTHNGSESYSHTSTNSSQIQLNKIDSQTTQAIISKMGFNNNNSYGKHEADVTGYITFTRDPLSNGISNIIDGELYQYFNFAPSSTYSSAYVNAGVSVPKYYINGKVYLNGSNIDFEGDFTYPSTTYGELSGHAILSGGSYSLGNAYFAGSYLSGKTFSGISLGSAQAVVTTDQSYLANVQKFNTSWLNGKTFYDVYSDDNGETWGLNSMLFTDSTISESGIVPADGSETSDYTVTSNGQIVYQIEGMSQPDYININSLTSTNQYLKTCWSNDINTTSCSLDEYLFLDKTKAETKLYELKADGTWEGSYTTTGGSSCTNGTMTMNFNANTSLFQWVYVSDNQSSNDSGSLAMNKSSLTIIDNIDGTIGTATIDYSSTIKTISGTYNDNGCSGTFELQKLDNSST